MPQINSGKSPPWVSGEIVTAAGLNGMIDSATIDPSAITAQSNLATLTGDEYTLIVDPSTGLLKKTQLKKALLTGEDIKTDLISQITGSSAILTIESNPSVAMFLRGTGGLSLQTETGGITINTIASGGTGTIGVQSNGMTFDGQGNGATGVIDFQTRTTFSYTSAVKIPVGTTAQRPATPVAGDLRFNSTITDAEVYNGSNWSSISQPKVYVIFGTATGATGGGENMVYQTPVLTVPSGETWIYEVYVQTTSGHVNGNTRSSYGDVRMTVYNNATLLQTINGSTAPYGGHVATHTFTTSFTSADVSPRLIVKTQTNYGYNEEPKYMIKLTKVKTSTLSDASSCI
jgi:hypothetical protein